MEAVKSVYSLIHHPYYYSASVLAKLGTNLASILWALIVLFAPHYAKEAVTPQRLQDIVNMINAPWPIDEIGAVGILTMCLVLIWCLVAHYKPIKLGVIAYTALAIFWLYGAVVMWTANESPAGATSAITTVALLSVYALLANPIRDADSR
jgi:hypothetical protein